MSAGVRQHRTMKLLLALVPLLASAVQAATSPCPSAPQPSDAVTIAWIANVRETTGVEANGSVRTTEVGSFRPVAELRGSKLSETVGSSLLNDQEFWIALTPRSAPLRIQDVESFLDHMGEDHCVFSAGIGAQTLAPWTLLTSRPLPGVFRAPTPAEVKHFARLGPQCVKQGDEPWVECTRPRLLGITDLNKDGKPEYWATEPYMWDIGLSVWEGTSGLTRLLQVCVGCSD